jgi:plasmid stabilization system protein ParE
MRALRSSNLRLKEHSMPAVKSSTKSSPKPSTAWSAKRERQYDHIKEGLEKRGKSEAVAEEIAARTVNKERARNGESVTASRMSIDDISSGRRGGLRSHKGEGGRTRQQLYEEARGKGIKGRSAMSKAELEKAVGR